MVRARNIDIEEEPDKVTVVIMANAVVDPRTMVV
jgi:hypothetical protein